MKLFKLATCLWTLTFLLMAPAIRAQNLCVLFFERPEHPFFTKMQNLFQNAPHTQFIPLAKPIDFLNCVQSQASEILIVAHSFEVSYVGSSSTKLGFFLPLSPEAAAKNQAQTITALHQALTAEKKHSHCFRPLDGKGPKRCPPRLQSLKRALQLVTRADPGSDLYQLLFAYEKGLFLDKPFELTLQWMRENPQSLTKIRLMSCDPQKIFKAYPAFQQIIAQFSIELDVAPTDWLLSLFSPHPVTSYDEDWVKKSLQPF